ncbi:hypothetical protein HK407_06g10750 [Ordospora pajunii]|jgi:hypothetical protein|uniref:uncharacterized protein n=1 Tax=Ordospora pajunii TaxID=3039483 RepID=UPI0029526E4F|nr:uncharacterized protein HK407_06g10750 [Ordospora pajunii]KAH9411245.1 hypothetical protein HK407_06g10750 [Ordospora pajunii]
MPAASPLASRISKLQDAGMFCTIDIDRLGYGSFTVLMAADLNPAVKSAKKLRSSIDLLMAESRSDGIKAHIEIIMLYTKGYMEESKTSSAVHTIKMWKGLAKYVSSVIEMLGDDDVVGFIKLVLFNIRFHYMFLEASLIIKQSHKGINHEGTLLYFLNEYTGMHEMLSSAGSLQLAVVQLCDLEELMRNKINSI